MELLKKAKNENFSTKYVSSLENEYNVNTFFRLREDVIVNSIINSGEKLPDRSPKEVFLALRRLRNKW